MNTFGNNIKITVFGESHGPGIGMVLDGIPAGIVIDEAFIREELLRRAPGGSELSTTRNESDEPVFMSGLFQGKTTGAPICAIIRNRDHHSSDYTPDIPRPSHADLSAQIKYNGFSDYRGGGHFSGRLTAAFVTAGAICKLVLTNKGIRISSQIVQVGPHIGEEFDFHMKKEILDARSAGDSVGSIIKCTANGIPAGIGGLMFGGMESRIAAMVYAVPGVKGLEFGAGFEFASMRGSEANDPIRMDDGRIYTETNNSGGINGGITNGMPLTLRVAFRPTPSIGREQKTINLSDMENITTRIRGRHDPCLAPRALPVVESCLAFCILDAIND